MVFILMSLVSYVWDVFRVFLDRSFVFGLCTKNFFKNLNT